MSDEKENEDSEVMKLRRELDLANARIRILTDEVKSLDEEIDGMTEVNQKTILRTKV